MQAFNLSEHIKAQKCTRLRRALKETGFTVYDLINMDEDDRKEVVRAVLKNGLDGANDLY